MSMIKVFLVEDEYAIREGIKKSVNWEQSGFTLVGEAGDGEVAFPKILKSKPDILITDIRMPFMDGLELSKLVKKELPDIRIIVLSGYDDFNYAKEAISIGVEEYILKPVSGENLMKELDKVAEEIRKEKLEKEAKEKYLRDREEIRLLERSRFIRDMIDGRVSMQESLSRGKELGIDITAACYAIVLLQVFPKSAGSGDMNEYSGVNEKIYNSIKEMYEDSDHAYMYEQVGDVFCFLEKADSKEDLDLNIKSGIENIKEFMNGYEDKMFFISVGKTVERIRDVNASYLDANRRFAERYMCDESHIFYETDSSRVIDINKVDISLLSKKTIYSFLKNGTLSEIDNLILEYFESIGKDTVESVMLRQYILVEALISSVTFLEELGVGKDRSTEMLGELSNPLTFVETSESAKGYLKSLLELMIGYRNQLSDKKYTEIIDKAKNYIKDNYQNEDMSLQSVASSVNVSSNHFSAIFRKETGETFIDYLTAVRMEKAKELLICTSMKTSEVGFEVGYRDPHYFSYIFKKSAGMSPKEYRRIKKENAQN
ncbi:MAG: response regulator [Eubacterium sp.]|nr:response regulator [Eubacterium sp.]